MTSWTAFWLCLAGLFAVASSLTRSAHLLAFATAAGISAGLAYAGVAAAVHWGAYAVCAVLLLFAVERVLARLALLRRRP